MLLYNYKMILEAGALKSLGTLSSKALDSKAAKGIVRYGELLLGDKANKRNLNNMLKNIEKNLDDIKVPTMMQRKAEVPAKFNRLDKVKYNSDENFLKFEEMEKRIPLKREFRTDRLVKSVERLYNERRKTRRALEKSKFDTNVARATTGAVMGTGAVGYGTKKINDKIKESKKTKLEKLKDKLKDIVTKD